MPASASSRLDRTSISIELTVSRTEASSAAPFAAASWSMPSQSEKFSTASDMLLALGDG